MASMRTKKIGDVVEIPIDRITVSPLNVRNEHRDSGIGDLKLSIKRVGLLQPITVFPVNGNYEVIVGQRRLLAYRELRRQNPEVFSRIKAVIIDRPDDRQAKLMSLVENLQRTDLTASEKTQACTMLLGELGTVRAVAEALGWTLETVTRWIRFERLVPSEMKKLVSEKKMSAADAMKISAATYPNLERANDIARSMVKERLTSFEKERLYDIAKAKPSSSTPELISEAKKPKELLTVTFHLAGVYKHGLENAVRERKEYDASSFAQRIVQDWLDERGYTRK